MGEVYLAKDTLLELSVALKILPLEVADNEERLSRFVREAKAASASNFDLDLYWVSVFARLASSA